MQQECVPKGRRRCLFLLDKGLPQRFDVIVSRAFASLGEFVQLTRQVLAPTGVWMAMKGRVPDDEIAALPPDVEMFHVEPLQVPGMDAQRCLVWMRPTSAAPPV